MTRKMMQHEDEGEGGHTFVDPQAHIGSATDFRDGGSGYESAIYHNDPDALQDHCEIM